MALVCAYEHRLAMVANTATCSGSRPAFNCTKPLALLAPPIATGTTTTATEPHFKRLTLAKMAAKRAWGECYNCMENFTKEHLVVYPVKGIFLLKMDTSMPDDLLDNTMPQILLNVIMGISAVL
jgi:hypothetical protein